MTDFKTYLKKTGEVGYISAIIESIAHISGLPGLKPEEMIITETGKKGIVHALNEKRAEVFMFNVENIKVGEQVTRTDETFKIPVNQNILGRIITPLCEPIDGFGPIRGEKTMMDIKAEAPAFTRRKIVSEPLETGVTIVDLMVPLGKGQRELVIGDTKTGKTTFLLQIVANQAKKNLACIYVSVGRKISDIKSAEEYLKKEGGFDNTVIVAVTAEAPSTVGYLAPFSGMAIAEYFRNTGKNSVIILDDLTAHAKIYREISLLLKRAPGRTAYPGDIFSLHATLLERAGNIENENGQEVSITALPVASTPENDLSGYIQTNLMAITDGHIFFDLNEFRKGKRPAVNIFLSVSRVGNQTKNAMELALANWVRKHLDESRRAEEIAGFGVELPEKTKKTIELGEKLGVIFNQDPRIVLSRGFQLFLFGLLLAGYWEKYPAKAMEEITKEIMRRYKSGAFPEIEKNFREFKDWQELKDKATDYIPKLKNLISYAV